jgi:tetratricopeptide (TPR) repeat protein
VLSLLSLVLLLVGCAGESAAPTSSTPARPVLFVGLDGADWQFLDPLIARGAMPNLAKLVAEGRRGVLRTETPPLSPLLWTTMMTGQGPLSHGILDFTRFHPRTREREPITSDERLVPAIWNMADQRGLSVAVLGMWATYPAESVRGLVVSDRLFSFQRRETPPPGVVSPASEEPWARRVLAEVEDGVGEAALRGYLPWLDAGEFARLADPDDPFAHPVSALRRVLIETAVYHRLAREWWERGSPQLAIVYHQGSDAIGHVLAPYTAPRQPGVSVEDFERYRAVPEQYFREVDRILGDYRRLAETRDAVLVLASDHGFLWGEGRPTDLSSQAQATAAKWHREEGIYLLWNAGLVAGEGAPGDIRQVCSTLLALLGLPRGHGLAQPPLAGIVATGPVVDYAKTFRRVAANVGSAATAAEDLEKLRALGYLGSRESAQASSGSGTRTAGSFNNEALLLEVAGENGAAMAALERALSIDPESASAAWNLSRLLASAGTDWERADRLLLAAIAAGLAEGEQQVAARARLHAQSARVQSGRRLLDAALAVRPEAAIARLARGRLRMEAAECRGAASDFLIATRLQSDDAVAFASLGLAYLCLEDLARARAALERSLALDPEQPEIRSGLAALR